MSNILCIYYARFLNEEGPKILFQSPVGFFTPEDFELVQDYVLTLSPELTGSGGIDIDIATSQVNRNNDSILPNVSDLSSESSQQQVLQPKKDLAGVGGVTLAVLPQEQSVVAVEHPGLSRPSVNVLGFPCTLHSSTRYARNTFLFSIGFVLPSGVDTGPYSTVLSKLGLILRAMEIESGLLSKPERHMELSRILEAVLEGLNTRGECFIDVDAYDTIALKLFLTSLLPDPPEVNLYDVPVRLRDLNLLSEGSEAVIKRYDGLQEEDGVLTRGLINNNSISCWDLGLTTILPHIDGINYVRLIAEKADMDTGLVCSGLRQLLFYGLIGMVDIFQYSNIYSATHTVPTLLSNPQLRRACMQFVQLKNVEKGIELETELQHGASFEFVFRLFTSFGSGTKCSDLCNKMNISQNGVDIRRLTTFGVLHGLLRRIHRYVVPRSANLKQQQQQQQQENTVSHPLLSPSLLSSLDGSQHLDQLCCKLKVGRVELEKAFEKSRDFVLVDR
jgi:hypothetical protein